MKTIAATLVLTAAAVMAGNASASANSTRGATAAADAHRAFQEQRSAYALTGEQTRRVQTQHLNQRFDGGRGAR